MSSFPRKRESRVFVFNILKSLDSRFRGNDETEIRVGDFKPGSAKRRYHGVLLHAFLLAMFWLAAGSAFAQAGADPNPLQFHGAAEEQRFHSLVSELRCVMCQNQSLADSNAQIAHDLRREVLRLIREGKSDEEVKQFLVARYGEFVLYQPRVESKTWLLWFGPLLLLLAGGLVIVGAVRKRSGRAPVPVDDAQEW